MTYFLTLNCSNDFCHLLAVSIILILIIHWTVPSDDRGVEIVIYCRMIQAVFQGGDRGRVSSVIYFFDRSIFVTRLPANIVSTISTYRIRHCYDIRLRESIVGNRVITVISANPNDQLIRTSLGPVPFTVFWTIDTTEFILSVT